MFSKNDFNTFSHVNDFAALVGTEGLLNVYNNKDANFTWYGKLIKSAVDYANQRKIVIQSVNDGNQEFEEILYLQFSDSGVSIDSYYHTMIGNKTMKELIRHDYDLFHKMMSIASNEYQTRYKDLKNLQL